MKVISDNAILEDDQFPSSDVVSQAVCTNSKSVSRRLFDVVDIEDATDADCTTVETSVCNQSSVAAQLPSSSEKLHSVCKHVLQGVFTEKDLEALSAKATQLIEKDSILECLPATKSVSGTRLESCVHMLLL